MPARRLAPLLGLLALVGVALVVAACGPAPSVVTPAPVQPTPVPGVTDMPPGTDAAPTAPAGAGEMHVTLGIYSGRPDPTWTLASDEAVAITKAIAALPDLVGTAPEGGLGYHGFVIEQDGRRVTVYLGVVATDGGGPGSLLADPDRTVERLLLELGRSHLAAAEIAEVERSLAAGS